MERRIVLIGYLLPPQGEGWEGALFQRIPALGLEGEFLIVAADEHEAELGAGDVADEAYVVELFYLLVVADGDGEEEFVVFAAVEGAGGDVEVELFGHDCGLVVDGDVFS